MNWSIVYFKLYILFNSLQITLPRNDNQNSDSTNSTNAENQNFFDSLFRIINNETQSTHSQQTNNEVTLTHFDEIPTAAITVAQNMQTRQDIRSDANSVHVVAVQNGPIISYDSENNQESVEPERVAEVDDFVVEAEDAWKTCKYLQV